MLRLNGADSECMCSLESEPPRSLPPHFAPTTDAELAEWGHAQRAYQQELYRSLGLDPDLGVDDFVQMLEEAS